MSEEKVPAQASIEEQLANAKREIQWLCDQAKGKRRALRERIFMDRSARSKGNYKDAMIETAEVVAFILGDGVYPPIHPPSEIDEIHAYLDKCGTLRGGSPDSPFSLEGRIKAYGVQHWNQGHAVGMANMMEIRDAETPVIQVTPDCPMIPLGDLQKWIEDNMPRHTQISGALGVDYDARILRKCLLDLAKHFGIPERNAMAIWPKTTESVLNSEDLARIVKVIDGRKDGHWELRDGGPVYVIDKLQNSGGGEGNNLEPTA